MGTPARDAGDGRDLRHTRRDRRADLLRLPQERALGEEPDLSGRDSYLQGSGRHARERAGVERLARLPDALHPTVLPSVLRALPGGALMRRCQEAFIPWRRMTLIAACWIPSARVRHP